MKYNLKQALKDYEALKVEVHIMEKSGTEFATMCKVLRGHNFEKIHFDVNFGTICATITNKSKGKITYYSVGTDIEIYHTGNEENFAYPIGYDVDKGEITA